MSEVVTVWTRIGVKAEHWDKLGEMTERINRAMPEESPISVEALAGVMLGAVIRNVEAHLVESMLQDLIEESRKGTA